ncbi:hypothetical protein Dd1591_3715 [Dickeya chrysanthemi Ech1591]|uniref:Uncharacterized protein n=1 Tax=Dickeya chrysanthemi (strain Ech1591) TaxID=561229 RepID=C6CLL7_DICC1|nr:hypothetical protein Dd1591_3715 [Dickeya chrysanthemi Ech1591]
MLSPQTKRGELEQNRSSESPIVKPYNDALRQRGSLAAWISDDAAATWYDTAAPRGAADRCATPIR